MQKIDNEKSGNVNKIRKNNINKKHLEMFLYKKFKTIKN